MFDVTCVRRIIDENMKTVFYFGYAYKVPLWVRYVAVDEDGEIFGYCDKPEISKFYQHWCADDDGVEMGTVDYNGDWKESLVEV